MLGMVCHPEYYKNPTRDQTVNTVPSFCWQIGNRNSFWWIPCLILFRHLSIRLSWDSTWRRYRSPKDSTEQSQTQPHEKIQSISCGRPHRVYWGVCCVASIHRCWGGEYRTFVEGQYCYTSECGRDSGGKRFVAATDGYVWDGGQHLEGFNRMAIWELIAYLALG